ncbi:MAG TPA: cytochrome c3 family protein [Anaeromyxobacteraceae bacterium]|nr:cytochrome c3 family protein [Anaeromyxobacteraceae bacterium]
MIALALALALAAPSDVRSTKHNLSATSSNSIRAATVDEVCVFCHTPHGAYQSRPIWNRNLSYQDNPTLYTIYGSTTLDAGVARPNGASKLCLSCHDGTLAFGALMNLDAQRPASVSMQGGVTTMPPGPTLLGTDLRNDHPISMIPSVALDPEIQLPPAGDDVRLREGSTPGVKDAVQCTSCHDPHLLSFKFLVKDNARGALCTTCHVKPQWLGSRHEASLAPYPAGGATTVGDRGCQACHTPHNGQSPSRLLQTNNLSVGTPLTWAEENVCFSCHQPGGTGIDPARGRAAPDIRTQFQKLSHHPVELKNDEHQPVFTNHLPEPEPALNDRKHVECADCHNPHRVQALPGNVYEGMKGVSLSQAVVVDDAATDLHQYELCFRCHGDTFAIFIPPAATRPPGGGNKREEFQPANAFHPVPGPGKNQSTFLNNVLDAPDGQLRGNDWQGNRLSRSSTVLCTDCHNNDQTSDTGGSARNSPSGPKGPHGSTNSRMLRANYSTQVGSAAGPPFGAYSPANFALCFLCHDEQRLLGLSVNRSNFFQAGGVGAGRGNLHWVHLVDRTNAACHECHYNVHSNVQAANTDYRNVSMADAHLVNFAPTVEAFPAARGTDPNFGDQPTKPRYGRTLSNQPYCFLSCHGKPAMDGVKSIYLPPNP